MGQAARAARQVTAASGVNSLVRTFKLSQEFGREGGREGHCCKSGVLELVSSSSKLSSFPNSLGPMIQFLRHVPPKKEKCL